MKDWSSVRFTVQQQSRQRRADVSAAGGVMDITGPLRNAFSGLAGRYKINSCLRTFHLR